MKKRKTNRSLAAAGSLLCCMMVLSACTGSQSEGGNSSNADENNQTTQENVGEVKNADYKVTVKDALGNPYTAGVVVKFMKDGQQAAMQVCDENGVAVKNLEAGDYTVVLSFTEGDEYYYYENDNAQLSAEKTEIEIIVARALKGNPVVLSTADNDYDAYILETGCTYVELTSENRNYFFFSPTEAGTYEFSVMDEPGAQIGYYGSPFYVFQDSMEEVTENSFIVSVKADMIGTGDSGTTVMVIGVDAMDESIDHCVIGIERIGEPEHTIEDEPWVVYERTSELIEYELPEGAEILEFDLTASSDEYELVLNETDGFYHLGSEDGPLVLVHLAKDPDYVSCYKTILENAGVNKYFFDEDGNFIRRELYTNCLLEYIDYADPASGLYPLTEDLKYIIQQNGSYLGWWDAEGLNYIFVDPMGNKIPEINNDIAWLFMCCYISEN